MPVSGGIFVHRNMRGMGPDEPRQRPLARARICRNTDEVQRLASYSIAPLPEDVIE